MVMGSDSTKGDSLKTLFHVVCKVAFCETTIVSMIMLYFHVPSCAKVFEVVFGLEG